MNDKAKLRSQIQNEPKPLPNKSFNYSSPIVDISTVVSHRSEYRCDSVAKVGRKNPTLESSFKSTTIQGRRTASCMFMPIKGDEMNSFVKKSRLAAFPNPNRSFNCIGSTKPSYQNFIEHSLHPDYFTAEDADDSEEFFLVLPTQSGKHYFCDPSQELSSRPAPDTLNNSREDSVLPLTHTCHCVDYRDHSSENHNEVAAPLTPTLNNTTPKVRRKYSFLKPRF